MGGGGTSSYIADMPGAPGGGVIYLVVSQSLILNGKVGADAAQYVLSYSEGRTQSLSQAQGAGGSVCFFHLVFFLSLFSSFFFLSKKIFR